MYKNFAKELFKKDAATLVRIITWNCQNMQRNPNLVRKSYSSTFSTKLEFIKDLKPDIVILQECPSPIEGSSCLWRDHIGVFTFNDWKTELITPVDGMPPNFLPLKISGKKTFNLLGIWSKPPYVKSVYDGLVYFQNFLKSADSVIVGDFNANHKFDGANPKKNAITFRKMVENIIHEELTLVSSYHKFFRETHGQERRDTYFSTRGNPYHIDYCFVPQSWKIKKVRLKPYKQGKDHSALMVEVLI